jgi:hypothetical protein
VGADDVAVRGEGAVDLAVGLHNLGALATLLLGGLGLLRPAAAARFTGLRAVTAEGRSEFRATYGGLFAALGAFALLAQDQVVFTGLGAAWVATGLGRLASIWLDDARTPRNYAAVALEGALGLLLLAPT